MSRNAAALAGAMAALVALAAWAGLATHAPRPALLAWLAALMFCLAPVLGAMAMLLIHALTGGGWGLAWRPAWLACLRPLPLLALAVLPLLFGLERLYPWAVALPDGAPPAQAWYLAPGPFVLRGLVCVALWLLLGWRLASQRRPLRPGAAALCLLLWLVSVTVATVDWFMSLQPQWHSAVFGMTVAAMQLLCAICVGVLSAPRLQPADGGALLLAALLGWGYLQGMDWLTAWSTDAPADVAWYLPRLHGLGGLLGAAMAGLHLLAFAALLCAPVRHGLGLRAVAATVLIGQGCFCLWVVLPALATPAGLSAWTLASAGLALVCGCATIGARAWQRQLQRAAS